MVWRSNHENTDSNHYALTRTYENQDYKAKTYQAHQVALQGHALSY